MSDVFISYSRNDSVFTRRLVDRLSALERDAWVDWSNIPYTADWWQEICQGIDAADNFVFIITPQALQSKICHQEVAYARAHNKRLIPILHKDVMAKGGIPLPQVLELWERSDWQAVAQANWQDIQRLNWLFFREEDDFDEAFAKLTKTIEQDLDHVRRHTRLLVRAQEWDKRQRENSFLLAGHAITEAEQWITHGIGKEPLPTPLHAEYINTSRARANQRRRTLFLGVTGALVVTAVLAVLAVLFGIDARENEILANNNASTAIAEEQRANANAIEAATQAAIAQANAATAVAEQQRADAQARLATSRQLAVQSDALVNSSYDLALLLGVGAVEIGNTIEARENLYRLLQANPALGRYLTIDEGEIVSLAISPDGRFVAYGDTEGFVHIWDMQSERRYGLPLADIGWVTGLAFFDDTQVLSSTALQSLSKWDIEAGEITAMPRNDFENNPQSLITGLGEQLAMFTADGQTLVALSFTNTLRIIDPATGAIRIEVNADDLGLGDNFEGSGLIVDLAIHPTGRYVFLSSVDRFALYEITDDGIVSVMDKQDLLSPAGAFSDDGRYLAWYDRPQRGDAITIQIMDLSTGETQSAIPVEDHLQSQVSVLAFAGATLYIGTNDGTLMGIDWESGAVTLPPATLHMGSVNAIRADASHNLLVTAGEDGRIALLHPDPQVLADDEPWRQISARAADSTLLLRSNESLLLIDAQTGDALFPPLTPYDDDSLFKAVLHPTENIVATLSAEQDIVRLWRYENGEAALLFEGQHHEALHLIFSPDGQYLLSYGVMEQVGVWHLEAQTFTESLIAYEDLSAFSASASVITSAFHPTDGNWLTVGSTIDDMAQWQIADNTLLGLGDIRYTIPENYASEILWSVAYSPDGQYLAGGTFNGTLMLWQTRNQHLAVDPIQVNGEVIRQISFSADSRLVAMLTDSQIHLYDTLTGRPFGDVLDMGGTPISDMSFLPQTSRLVVTGGQQVMTWDFDTQALVNQACARANRNLSSAQWEQFIGDFAYQVLCPQQALAEIDRLLLNLEFAEAQALLQTLTQSEVLQTDTAMQRAICRLGVLAAMPETVMPACEQAVELLPDDRLAVESRGIAYALMGDLERAMVDLESARLLADDPTIQARYTAWIEALNNGEAPFGDDTLRRMLRNEDALTQAYRIANVPALDVPPDRVPLTSEAVAAAVTNLNMPFVPLTFSGNRSPLLGWNIVVVEALDYDALGNVGDAYLPGKVGFRFGLRPDGNAENLIAVIQSEAPLDAALESWKPVIDRIFVGADGLSLSVEDVPIYYVNDNGIHMYFFIRQDRFLVVGYLEEDRDLTAQAMTVIEQIIDQG